MQMQNIDQLLEIVEGYLGAASKGLAKSAQVMADYAAFTTSSTERHSNVAPNVAQTLMGLQEATILILEEVTQMHDDLECESNERR